MSGNRLRVSAVLAVLLAGPVACLDYSPSEPVEPFECADESVDREGWRQVQTPTFDYALPSSYQSGGTSSRWENGRAFVDVHILSTGETPPDEPVQLANYSECRADIGGHSALVQLGSTGSTSRLGRGWYMSSSWLTVPIDTMGLTGTLLIEAWSPTNAVLEEFLSIMFSVRFTYSGP